MVYALAAVFTAVGNNTVTVLQTLLGSDLGDHSKNMTDQRGILFGDSRRGIDMLFGDDQKMQRSLRHRRLQWVQRNLYRAQ